MQGIIILSGSQKQHKRFYLYEGIIFILAITRAAFLVDIPVYIYLVISVALALSCDKEEILAYMCGLMSMAGIMQNRIALIIVATVYLFHIGRAKLRNAIPFVLLCVWEVAHGKQSDLSLYGMIKEFAPWYAVAVVLIDNDKLHNGGFILRSFAISTIVCSLINLIACNKQFGYSIFSLARMGDLSTDRQDFRGLINPNPNSFMCVIAISALLLLRHKFSEKPIDKWLIICLVAFVLLTQSKSAILCVAISYILYFLFSSRVSRIRHNSIKRGLYLLLLLLVGLMAFGDLIDVIIARFSDGDFTNGRSMINAFYYRHITGSKENFLIGIGAFNYPERIKNLYGSIWQLYPDIATMAGDTLVFKPCHLAILEIVVAWGVIGIIFVGAFFYLIIKETKNKDDRRILLVTMAIILIYSLQCNILDNSILPHALLIALVCSMFRTSLFTADCKIC